MLKGVANTVLQTILSSVCGVPSDIQPVSGVLLLNDRSRLLLNDGGSILLQ